MKRHDVKEMVCSYCDARQPMQQDCAHCGTRLGMVRRAPGRGGEGEREGGTVTVRSLPVYKYVRCIGRISLRAVYQTDCTVERFLHGPSCTPTPSVATAG